MIQKGKWKLFLKKQLSISLEETRDASYREITEGVKFKGYNLLALFFAMLVACIGLNINSEAAIIGAMLISPMTGPVIGFSFGLSVNDRNLKRLSLINGLKMVGISIFASTLFFLVSPFENNNAALQSFSHATIFDIMLAFFAGMAGFIGILRKDGTKVLAGVAVATSFLPPLCTAGFGLAHLNWITFIGGVYFFSINCLFMGMATFFGARFFRFYKKSKILRFSSLSNLMWSVFIIAMIIPGVKIAYDKWNEEKQQPENDTNNYTQQQIDILKKQVDSLGHLINVKDTVAFPPKQDK